MIDGKTFIEITTKILEPGFPDRLHVGLHPEAGVQVRVRGEGGDEGLRHVHPLKVARQELDCKRTGEAFSEYTSFEIRKVMAYISYGCVIQISVSL